MIVDNLFSLQNKDDDKEYFEQILKTQSVRIEKIISYGQSSSDGFWYDQDENEWVVVLEGEAKVNIEGEIKTLQKGEYLNIPAHIRHRVEYTANPTVWLAVFYK